MNYPMQRLPYGAQVFEAEVKNLYPDATFDYDDRDGLGIYRTITIATESSGELGDLLEPIMDSSDPRIVGWIGSPGSITVVFTATDEAENAEPFYLARVRDTLLPASDPTPPKKRTTKKAAPKG